SYFGLVGKEVDFLLRSAGHEDQLLQVCSDLSEPDTRRREFQALAAAGSELGLHGGTVLTWDEEGLETTPKFSIQLTPIWKWLLGK
ncbi:MAG: ATP-binding protein, partial [Verrucomicrobia bacterium]|nr:ATP-binding protein [Verrucomicrobiota bacterium]